MATYTWVDLKIPEAALLADLNGIVSDLQRTREFTELLIAEYKCEAPNWQLIEALSIAIAVTYARVFSGGVRYHLKESDLSVLSEPQRAAHRFLRDYRDKHVAHSVNEFEENIARANYCQERVESEGITSISYSGARITGLGSAEVQAVIEITSLLETHLRDQIKIEEQRVLAIVRAMPLEVVLTAGQKAFRPSLEKVARRRK